MRSPSLAPTAALFILHSPRGVLVHSHSGASRTGEQAEGPVLISGCWVGEPGGRPGAGNASKEFRPAWALQNLTWVTGWRAWEVAVAGRIWPKLPARSPRRPQGFGFLPTEEIHAEVCYAECLLQRAALTFLQVGTPCLYKQPRGFRRWATMSKAEGSTAATISSLGVQQGLRLSHPSTPSPGQAQWQRCGLHPLPGCASTSRPLCSCRGSHGMTGTGTEPALQVDLIHSKS